MKINVDEIIIEHPSFKETENSGTAKIRIYIKPNEDKDRTIDRDVDGSTNSDESVEENLINHQYINTPKIKKEKTGLKKKRKEGDENTKKYLKENDNLRTSADVGGINTAKGLEFSNLNSQEVKGELKEFIEVLNLLGKMYDIKSVDFNIVYLPLERKFSYLSDRITRRQCIIARIVENNGNKYSIIEVEREEKSLSTLLLIENQNIDWNYTYKIILEGLVNESGKWSNEVFGKLKKTGIKIDRIKHISKKNYKKAIFINGKLI